MRYFASPSPRRGYFDDEYPNEIVVPMVTVCEHVAVETGLIDQHGNAIMRAPNPMSFGKDEDW